MKKKLPFCLAILLLFMISCSSNGEEFNTSKFNEIGRSDDESKNTYLFPAYEVILDELPFTAKLPAVLPIPNDKSNNWQPGLIYANADLAEVKVELSMLHFEGNSKFDIWISNYEPNHWQEEVEVGREITQEDKVVGYFNQWNNGAFVIVNFLEEDIYYRMQLYDPNISVEEKVNALIKSRNSLVDYNKWYDSVY
ncbi:hypothetical protein [Evansella cellulosilytica]|uniref:Uncharacterized protein n=1 Tax=Evansella cellulosilytica (strain ATCC 21833 / DSM 2522 / FERM P-1141 / JCM 9156 / N-4) TaxID=649639 RepID=E6TR56_EVAC2|nr:hypothetical protein [Evansella cellulosilytica]ADU30568.1 hypothetical protein Bcell_2308 [Evansella cellulosilytica DSM 2522]